MTKRISVKAKAYQSNGFSRACKNCIYRPCTPMQSNLCTRAYVEGYMKGYKRAKKDMKDDNR
jgi:hypothetical protein